MKRNLFLIIVVLFNTSCAGICISPKEDLNKEYGTLSLAVKFSSSKVIGEYDNNIPQDFNADKFLKLIEHKIPSDYYETLKKYSIEIQPKQSYYLIIVSDPKSKSVIMFDYSCAPELVGPVYQDPKKFDVNNLEIYDKCLK